MTNTIKRFIAAIKAGKLTKKQVMTVSATAIVILAVLIIFRRPVKALLSLATLFMFGAFSTYYKRKLESFGAIGFEFVTFSTVLAGVAFGPVMGGIFGFAVSVASVAISKDMGPTTFLFFIATSIIGAVVQPLSAHLGIVLLGLASLAFSAIMVQSFTLFMQKDAEISAVVLVGIAVNFAVNYLLLLYLATPILHIIY